jgi:uncharacterized membrane protein
MLSKRGVSSPSGTNGCAYSYFSVEDGSQEIVNLPFCTNCGTKVDTGAAFCYNCGTAQPRSTAQFHDFLDGISNRTASILCYIPVFGVIPAIIFLASQKFRSNARVRFDAFQALYLFVAWLIISSAIPTLLLTGVSGWGAEHGLLILVKMVVIVCWIYLLVKAAQEQQVRLPIIGDLAARSTTEQL